jgi:hypothetical protein
MKVGRFHATDTATMEHSGLVYRGAQTRAGKCCDVLQMFLQWRTGFHLRVATLV